MTVAQSGARTPTVAVYLDYACSRCSPTRGWLLVILTGMLIGALWGVTVTAEHADWARQMLGQLTFPSLADPGDRTIAQEPDVGREPIQERLFTRPGKRLSETLDRAQAGPDAKIVSGIMRSSLSRTFATIRP